MKVLDFALQMEEMGRNYYERLAAETSLNGIRAVFSMLAEEQQELYDTFQAMKRGASAHCNADSLTLDRAWQQFGRIFAGDGTSIALLKSDLDAYRHAVQVEADIVGFFEELAKSERNAEARAMLNEVAAVERKSYRRVETIHDFVAAPTWQLSWGEFSNLDEF